LSYPSGIQKYSTVSMGKTMTQGILENGMLGDAGVLFFETPR
jgi:hypothetical protein